MKDLEHPGKFVPATAIESEYGLSRAWLQKRRRLGLAPRYFRVGRMVRYRRTDVEEFLRAHSVEPGNRY